MQMIFCPNCQKLTGFKRALGFGTLFMVVITFGLWLLVLPFYPALCINCGLTRGSAFWQRLSETQKMALVCVVVGVVLFIAVSNRNSTEQDEHQPAPIIKGPNYNEAPVRGRTLAGATNGQSVQGVPVDNEVMNVEATALLAAFESDEATATARYGNRKISVTGVLTGVFIPTLSVSIRMAEKGTAARAFVTMAGPTPHSAEETLLLPGIQAYSDSASLFGLEETSATADTLSVGKRVTLACTCGQAFRVSDLAGTKYDGAGDYSLELDDCVLQNPRVLEKASDVVPEPASDLATNSIVYKVGGDVQPPRAIYSPDPEYTDEARQVHLQGTCGLEVVVGADGRTQEIRVIRPIGGGLDERAVEAVRQWRFQPAMRNGRPVPVEVQIDATFKMY